MIQRGERLYFYTAHLSFELVVDVCEDESGDLNKRDDKGAFSQSPQVVADGASNRGEDGSSRQLGFIPSETSREDEWSLKSEAWSRWQHIGLGLT